MLYGDHYSEGCRLLMKYLNTGNKGKPMSQKEFSEASEVSQTFINHLLYGRKRPSISTALKISTMTKGSIPIEAWAQDRVPPKG